MINILKKLPDTYHLALDLINEGSLKREELPYVYEIFTDKKYSEYHSLKNELLFAIKKFSHLLDGNLFYNAFKINKKQMDKFLKVEPKIAYFPIADNKNVYISKVYVYELNDNTFPNTFPNSSQTIIDAINDLQRILNKNFFVSFDSEPFTDISFQLAIASTFFVEDEFREKYIFSGSLDKSGNVLPVGFEEKKKEISKKDKKLFISYRSIKNIKDLQFLNTDSLNIPFIQLFAKTFKELENNFNIISNNISNFLNAFSIQELSIFHEDLISNDLSLWDEFLKEVKEKLDYIFSLPFNVTLHFLGSLSAFSFAIGIMLGAKKKVVIYHFQDGEIFKVMDLSNSLRVIKSKAKNFKYLNTTFKSINSSNEAGIIIYFASHDPGKSAEQFLLNLKCNIIKLALNEFQGNIPVNDTNLWIEIVRELYSAIDDIEEKLNKKIEKFHFIFSIPVPIAFALGMALGDYKKIAVYNFDKSISDYKLVLDSKKSKFLKNFY